MIPVAVEGGYFFAAPPLAGAAFAGAALAGAAFKRWQPAAGWRQALFFGVVCFAADWLRGWLFTGFPWLALGYSQAPPSPLAGFAPIVGVYGLTLIVATITALKGGMVIEEFLEVGGATPGIRYPVRIFGLLVPLCMVLVYLYGSHIAQFTRLAGE